MKIAVCRLSMIGAAAAIMLLSGCATTDQVKEALTAAQNAQSSADRAQSTADGAAAAAQAANGAAQRAQASADQAGSAAQSANAKIDTFISEECAESRREAQRHSACPKDARGVKG